MEEMHDQRCSEKDTDGQYQTAVFLDPLMASRAPWLASRLFTMPPWNWGHRYWGVPGGGRFDEGRRPGAGRPDVNRPDANRPGGGVVARNVQMKVKTLMATTIIKK